MKILFAILSVSLLSVPSFASEAREVDNLSSASFSSSMTPGPRTLTVEYSTGGCGAKGHKTSYKLELVSQKEEEGTNLAIVKVHVMQIPNGGCRMAYSVKNTVDLNALLKEQGAAIGISKAEGAFMTVRFEVPQVSGYTFME